MASIAPFVTVDGYRRALAIARRLRMPKKGGIEVVMIVQFYRPVEGIRTFKAKVENRERGILLYCETSRNTWSLQVRSPISLGSSGAGADGKDFVIASAPLSVDDMRALRDAIDAFLVEAEDGHVDRGNG